MRADNPSCLRIMLSYTQIHFSGGATMQSSPKRNGGEYERLKSDQVELTCWDTGWLPWGASQREAPPAGTQKQRLPWPPGGAAWGEGGGTGGSPALAAFTCYSRHSLHSLARRVSALQTKRSLQAQPSPAVPVPVVPATPPGPPARPTVTWASPQSRRPAAGAGGLCSSDSSWLRPEVRFTEPGHWGRARGGIRGWGEWVVGQMGYPGSPLQPAGHPPPYKAGRLLGLPGRGQRCLCQVPWLGGGHISMF